MFTAILLSSSSPRLVNLDTTLQIRLRSLTTQFWQSGVMSARKYRKVMTSLSTGAATTSGQQKNPQSIRQSRPQVSTITVSRDDQNIAYLCFSGGSCGELLTNRNCSRAATDCCVAAYRRRNSSSRTAET